MKLQHVLFTAGYSLVVIAATEGMAQEQGTDNVELLSTWSYEPLYANGWSVGNMFDETEVIGATGEVIGDVENVIFSNDGEVLSIIAQVGGLWDIGDTHVNVPWDEVSLDGGIGQISTPISEENIEDYDVFGDYWEDELITRDSVDNTQTVDDDLVTGPEIFKATDLIGDYAFLSTGVRYGYVADLVVQNGAISAIVSDAAAYGRHGYYAYPYAYRSDMVTGARYDLPYAPTEIEAIENFDYERLQTGVPQ